MISLNFSTMLIASPYTNSSLSVATAIGKNSIDSSNQPGSSTSIKVNISPQAQEKLEQEKNDISQKLGLQKENSKAEKTKENKSDTETKSLDKLIGDTQERIKEIQEKIRRLKGKNTEEVQQERKMLESQIMSLNAILISLFGKKLEALEP